MRLKTRLCVSILGVLFTVGMMPSATANTTTAERICDTQECKAQMRNLSQLARNGSGRAAAIVAMAYATGDGLEKDLDLAKRFIKQGARFKDPVAIHMLSSWYKTGFVVEQDLEKAQLMLDKAIKYDYKPAMYQRAVELLKTEDQANIDKGIGLLTRAADGKLSNAMFLLARLKQTGSVVPKDLEGAGELLKSLARSRYPEAHFYLKQVVDELSGENPNEELLAELRSVKNVEVIDVQGQRLEVNFVLDNLVEKLNLTGKYDSRSIGSRIRGVSCAEAAYCTSSSPNATQGASSVSQLLSGEK